MKDRIYKILIFALLAFAFSSLSACTGAEDTSSAVNTANGKKANSGYPPLADKIAQSDLRNLDGSTFKVADKKGKVVLLNLWATWCAPCRQEMPALVKMQDEHRDQGFEIIGLNTDDDGDTREKIEEFAQEMKLNYKLVWADTDLQAAMLKISQFPGIPQSFLVDRDGRLRGVFKGGGSGEVKKLAELVAKVVNDEDGTVGLAPEQPAYAPEDNVAAGKERPAEANDEKKAGKDAQKDPQNAKSKE